MNIITCTSTLYHDDDIISKNENKIISIIYLLYYNTIHPISVHNNIILGI